MTLRAVERALFAVVRHLHQPAYVVDDRGHVTAANAAASAALERHPGATESHVVALARGGSGFDGHDVMPLGGAVGLQRRLVLVGEPSFLALRLADFGLRWSLTKRQADVLALVVQGRSNKEIGKQLGCSVKTVDVHVSVLMKKSGANSRGTLSARVWSDGTA